jgi:hypothetical protein
MEQHREGKVMTVYEIRVKGQLDQQWSAWFDGLSISYDSEETTLLRGWLPDEAALHGILAKVRDLAVPLLSVNQVIADTEEGKPK